MKKQFAHAAKLEPRYTSASEHVGRLTPSLLAKAFQGELVEQDPNDEPAEKLLEKVRAGREDVLPKEIKKSRRKEELRVNHV